MEVALKLAWLSLAVVHGAPAAVALMPDLVTRLYGVAPGGDLGILIRHRGALFLGLCVACLLAGLDPAARRAIGVLVGISIIGFLLIYVQAGAPAGPLRTIALVDCAALIPLAFVIVAAWRA